MVIKLNNNTEIFVENIFEEEEYFNGASRRTLTCECKPDSASVDSLNAEISKEDNIKVIEVKKEATEITFNGDETKTEKTTVTDIYDGYVLKLKCGIENKLIQTETPDAPAVYEDRLVFKLGKRTYIEEQLKKLGL